MSDKTPLEFQVANYTGGDALTLETGSRDGRIYIGLSDGKQRLKCALEPEEARAVSEALLRAVDEL